MFAYDKTKKSKTGRKTESRLLCNEYSLQSSKLQTGAYGGLVKWYTPNNAAVNCGAVQKPVTLI